MQRLLTGIALIGVALYLVFWAPSVVFIGGAIMFGLLCYWEFGSLMTGQGIKHPGLVCLLGGLMLLILPIPYVFLTTVLVMLAAFTASLRFAELRDVGPHVAAVLLGAFYAFAPWRFAIELRAFSVHILFFALALNWAGDSLAYYVGRRFGKHKLAPIASPKKSWEGAIASVAGAVVFGVFYVGHFVPKVPHWEVIVIAVVANIAGQFGDLAESALKRGAGVKDSGKLLPGHGGALDRLDSTLFSLPVVYALLLAFHQIS